MDQFYLEMSTYTEGGCSFEQLCKGLEQNYACDNVINLIGDDGHALPLSEATGKLVQHVKDCIQSIEMEQDRKVGKFYIGTTSVHGRKNIEFDNMNPLTWRRAGISNAGAHRDNGYGRDGLVVLTVVTKVVIPSSAEKKVNQELYALALESRLVQHF